MPRKPTTNQREFEKQVRKLNRSILKLENEGLIFIERPIEPVKPKRITKKFLQALEEETSLPSLRSKAYKVDQITGELTPAVEKVVRKARKRGTFKPLTGRQITFNFDERPRLTPEELAEIRREAGRKAQETIKRRMAEDPEYARHMKEVRQKALEKARETIKRRMAEDPEYAQHMREIWAQNLTGHGKPRRLPPTKTQEEGQQELEEKEAKKKRKEVEDKLKSSETEEEPLEPDDTILDSYYEPASATEATLDNMYEILSHAINEHVANYLTWLANHQWSTEEDKKEFAQRLATMSYFVLDLATQVAYYDSTPETLRDHSSALAEIISLGDYSADDLEQAVYFDRPYKH